MKLLTRFTLVLAVSLGISACTIPHNIAEDYPQYLKNNSGSSNLPQTRAASEYNLTPSTENYRYEFRAVTTGYGNLWIVEFGKMLDDTLKSEDVQRAFGQFQKRSETNSSSNGLLIFDLEKYTFEDFGAHIVLKVSLLRDGKTALSKTYSQDGKTQGGKMFWGGVFAQRNAVQQSTKLALDEILRQLIKDLNELKEN